jgi:hypothetical protein
MLPRHSASTVPGGVQNKVRDKVRDRLSLRLDFDLHELECPLCQKRTRHAWPGATILFSTAKCEHCAEEFLIVQNKPWLGDNHPNRPQS